MDATVFRKTMTAFFVFFLILFSLNLPAHGAVPAAPAGLTAIAGNGEASLSWMAVSGATDYVLYRASAIGEPGHFVAQTQGTSHTIRSHSNDGYPLPNDTPYYYVVTALNADGQSTYSTQVGVTPTPTVLKAPDGVTAMSGNGQVSLIWNPVTSAVSYNVLRATSRGGPYTLLAPAAPGPIFTDREATNDIQYFYVVQTMSLSLGLYSDAVGAYSEEVSATPWALLPSAPTSLIASPGSTWADLSWSPSDGATTYVVYRREMDGGHYAFAAQPNTLAYEDTWLSNGTTYYYAVAGVNAYGRGAFSVQASASVSAVEKPHAALISATFAHDQGASISWGTGGYPPGALSYTVRRSTTSGGPYESLGTFGIKDSYASYGDTGLTNGITYYYVVDTHNDGDTIARSNEVAVTPVAQMPAPANVAVIAGNTQATVTWEPVVAAGRIGANYSVSAATSPGGSGQSCSASVEPSCTFASLTNGQIYYFRVRTFDSWSGSSTSASAWSAEVSAIPSATLPLAPTGLNVALGNTQVSVTWTEVSGASSYKIYRGTEGSPSPAALVGTSTVALFTDTGLVNARTSAHDDSYYRVAAVNADGTGAWSKVSPFHKPLASYAFAPTNVAVFVGNTQATMTWDPVIGSLYGQYSVIAATSPGGPPVSSPYCQRSSCTVAGLTNGQIYYFRVQSIVFSSAYSAELSATPSMMLPPAPTGLLSSRGNTQISLTWTAVSGATSYKIYRKTAGDAWPVSSLGTSIGTLFTDTELVNGTKYCYSVVAVNDYGPGAWAQEVCNTPSATKTLAPTHVAPVAGNTQATVTWNPVIGAASYCVIAAVSPGGQPISSCSTSVGPGSTITGLTNGQNYFFRVQSSGPGSAYSAEASATPLVTLPLAPTGLHSSPGNSQISLDWTAVNGATSYEIYRRTEGSPWSAAPVGTSTGPVFADTGLVNGTKYCYSVAAANAAGTGAWSLENCNMPNATVTTTTAITTTTTTSPTTSTTLVDNWSPVAGEFQGGVIRSTVIPSLYSTTASGDSWVAVYYAGMFKRAAGSSTWTPMNTGLTDKRVYSIAAHTGVSPYRGYVATVGGGVFKTIDGGAHWTPVNTGLGCLSVRQVQFIGVAATATTAATNGIGATASTDRLLASTSCDANGGVYLSADGGANWTPTSGMPAGVLVNGVTRVNPAGSGVDFLLAATFGGVYRSTDNGLNWTLANGAITSPNGPNINNVTYLYSGSPAALTLYASEANTGVWKSNYDAAGWGTAPVLNKITASGVATDGNANGNLYYAVDGEGIYKSADRGATWTMFASNAALPGGRIVLRNTTVTGSPNFFALTNAGVYQSADGGVTWNKASAGLPGGYTVNAAFDSAGNAYVAAAEGVFKAAQTGSTFQRLGGFNLGMFARGGQVIVTPADVPYAITTSLGVFKYDGTNWVAKNAGLPTMTRQGGQLRVDPSNANGLYLGLALGGMYYSADAGETWAAKNTGLSGKAMQIRHMAVTSAYAIIATNDGIYKSTDAGASWVRLTFAAKSPANAELPADRVAIDPGTGNLYAAVYQTSPAGVTYPGSGIWKSADGGTTWAQSLAGMQTHDISVARTASGVTLYAGVWDAVGGGAMQSMDEGATWTLISTGLTNNYIGSFGVAGGVLKTVTTLGDGAFFFTHKPGQAIGAISFSPAAPVWGSTTTVSATASSGLAVSFTSMTSTVCTVSGRTVVGVTAGACVIAADQAGNAGYDAATQVTRYAVVGQAPMVAAGGYHSLALKSDGTVVAWGYDSKGQSTVPAGLADVVAVAAAGGDHSLSLKSDGTVVAWGANDYGQTTVPPALANVVAVAAGVWHSLALKSDGTVVAWGSNSFGKTTVPAGLAKVVAVAAGGSHSLTLKSDGTVVAWGYNSNGQSTVPAGLTNVVGVAGGWAHTLAVRSDGTVAAWGANDYGQSTVPSELSNAIAVAAGTYHSLALTSDGLVVAWGSNSSGQTAVPAGLSNVVAIAAGAYFSLALKSDGTVVAWGENYFGQSTVPAGLNLRVSPAPAIGVSPSSLSFAAQTIGTTSAVQTVALTSTGSALLNISSIAASGDYARTTACDATLAVSTSCAINVTFTPTATGARSGSLTISSDAAGSPHTVSLSGTGIAEADTEAPSVPTGLTATATSSTQINLAWTASTDNIGVTQYKIYRDGNLLSTSGGAPPASSYNDTGLSASTAYTYTVAACDAAGNCSGQSASAAATTLSSTTGLNLDVGWNLMGNGSSGSIDVASAFGDTTKVTTAWKWIAGGAKWAFYAPSLTGQALNVYAASKGYDVLSTISGGEGFWINAKSAFTATLPAGTAINSASFQGMAPGWNLIAVGDNKTPRAFNSALSATPPAAGEIPLNVITLWAWDAPLASWYFYAPSLDKSGALAGYIATKNYLDFGNKALEPTTGFWVNKP